MLSISDYPEFILFMAFAILTMIFLIILLVVKIKKNKKVIRNLKPSRSLNEKDLKAIQFLEIDGNLSVNFLLKKLPQRKKFKNIWRFTNCTFYITSTYRSKRIIHLFVININDEIIEIFIPDIFLPYIKQGDSFKNKTIEVLYRLEHFALFSIEGVIGYNSLYEKFQLEQKSIDSALKRHPTKEELTAFTLSKWGNMWAIMLPVFLPIFILSIMSEGIGLAIVFLPLLSIIVIPLYKAYKKRKKYIDSRMVYFLEGTLWFDEDNTMYRINEDELKLHRKWKKIITNKRLPIHNIKMEALLHTFSNLDSAVCKKFQPIDIKSNTLNIKESNVKSTRSWGVIFLYCISFGIIAFNAPANTYKGHLILNPLELLNITDSYLFDLAMTLIWWASIIATLYLTFLLVSRIRGHYFQK